MTQRDGDPLLRGQRGELALDAVAELTMLAQHRRGRRGIDGIRRIVQRRFSPAREAIEAQVHGDTVNPRREPRLRSPPPRALPEPEKDLLSDILALGATAERPGREAHDAPEMP